ncbi:hypothetical protein D021_3353A, partial [Vibrio parahaemolyticus 10296]|jgi:hypothetical protein
MHL